MADTSSRSSSISPSVRHAPTRSLALLVASSVAILLFASAQAFAVVQRQSNCLLAASFISESTGWVVGTEGSIYKTIDGGVHWSAQNSGTAEDLTSVSFVDGSHGWAVGGNGGDTDYSYSVVLKTTDGGVTWNNITPEVWMRADRQWTWIRRVKFVDANTGWGADFYHLYKTIDGGATWIEQKTDDVGWPIIRNMHFVDAATGWVQKSGDGDDVVYKTTDGGSTWVPNTSDWLPGLMSRGFQVGSDGLIQKSSDNGATWATIPSGTTRTLHTITFASSAVGWAMGGEWGVHTVALLKTVDGGDTWTKQQLPLRKTATISNPVAPMKMSRSTASTVFGYLKPHHRWFSNAMRIYRYRKVSGVWKPYGYVSAPIADYSSYSKYSAKVKLPYAGSWRLRAYSPADGTHEAAWSTGYDYVTVK